MQLMRRYVQLWIFEVVCDILVFKENRREVKLGLPWLGEAGKAALIVLQ